MDDEIDIEDIKMDDEIDIEEHDVLDNPVIKSIFPDLAALKRECTYEFEDLDTIENTENFNNIIIDSEDLYVTAVGNIESSNIIDVDDYIPQNILEPKKSNKIILGSKPVQILPNINDTIDLVSKSDLDLVSCNINTTDVLQPDLNEFAGKLILGSKTIEASINDKEEQPVSRSGLKDTLSNDKKIVLGTKPNKFYLDTDNTQCTEHAKNGLTKHIKIILQDINAYLNKNSRYCKICLRLFLSKNALEVHKKKDHSRNPDKTNNFKKGNCLKKHKCICGTFFCNSANLTRHYRTQHTDILKKFMKTQSNSYKCDICKINFKTPVGLNIHYFSEHDPNSSIKSDLISKIRNQDKKRKSAIKKRKIHTKEITVSCITGERHNNRNDMKNTISHTILKTVNNNKANNGIKSAKKDIGLIRLKCICGSNFSSKTTLYRHCKNQHTDLIKKFLKNKPQSLNSNCTICKIKFRTNVGLGIHYISKHQTYTVEAQKEDVVPLCPNKKRKIPEGKLNRTNLNNRKSESVSNNHLVKIETSGDRKKRILKPKNTLVQNEIVALKKDSVNQSSKRLKINENRTSKYTTRANSTHKDDKLCLHCNTKFKNREELIDHMYQILEPKRSSSENVERIENNLKNHDDKVLLACRHCSYYLLGISAYFTHIIKNHKIEKFLQINKEQFEPQCKYCPYKCLSISAHNNHICRYHADLINVKIEDEIEHDKKLQHKKCTDDVYEEAFSEYNQFALETVIFECNKCSTCFLSSDIAVDHEQHKELLINWKCPICSLILKDQDKVMHLKQHSYTSSVKVINLHENANVLYICTKCAIHFTENGYQKHYPYCGSKITDCFRCNKCDILIDKVERNAHENHHKNFGDVLDFTIVNSDLVIVDEVKDTDSESTDIVCESNPNHIKKTVENNCLTYCPTCKVFLKDLGRKNKNHIDGTCAKKVVRYICDECGLVFTNSVLVLHKDHHEKEKALKLQDYKFFNLQGKQVRPPIPEYPHCKRCDIHFHTKKAVYYKHNCGETEFFTCDICKIKLSRKAYNLHMSFHFYEIQTPPGREPDSKTNMENNKSKNAQRKKTEEAIDLNTENTSVEDSLTVLFTCKTCNISVESYDEVIKHCQEHYSNKDLLIGSLKKCKQCSLSFDSRSYICHQQRVHFGGSKIQVLKFDPAYYTSNNTTWIKHVFENVPQKCVLKLLEKSIYQHEHRLQLECIQRGSSNWYLYKCDQCKNCVDHGNIYDHTVNPCGPTRKRQFCPYCGYSFRTWQSRHDHVNLHLQNKSIKKKSLNIILFNQNKDNCHNNRIFCTTNKFNFYQCRNCCEAVENSVPTNHKCNIDSLRKCETCGLLIHYVNLISHNTKHSAKDHFRSDNFKVILFGREIDKTLVNKLSSSFLGTVYDYTLYTCKRCEMTLRNTEYMDNHICRENYELDRAMCDDCGLFFPSTYTLHARKHRIDPDFIKENMNIIEFNDGQTQTNVHKELGNDVVIELDDDDDDDQVSKEYDPKTNDEKTLYKCKCGLHFVNKENIIEHKTKRQQKQYKQNCPRCNLLFNASELFTHLVAHHKEKNQAYNFKIVEFI